MSDVWHVKLAAGQAQMTLDELDAAYQNGAIDERTEVREEGSDEWTTLGALLGIEPPAPRNETIPPAHVQQESVRPLSMDLDDLDESQLKGKGKRNVVLGLAGAAVALVLAAVAIVKLSPDAPKAAAAQPAMVTVPTATEETQAAQPKLTEEQRQALAKQDEERQKKAREARDKRVRETPVSNPKQKSGPVFSNKGDKYDPLNAGL